MKRIGVLSSGGDTPGTNAAIRAVVKMAAHRDIDVMGIRYGFCGLISGDIQRIDEEQVRDIAHQGGTILKTTSCKEFLTEEGQKKAVKVAEAFDLEGIICIGGDGTMRGAAALSYLGMPTIALPGTIDNDLAYTDFTIGFDTAVNGALEEMGKIKDTMVSHDRIGVVEVMGNNSGDIALYTGLAGSFDYIIIPELECDLDDLCDKVTKNALRGKLTSMIVVAEGAGKGSEIAKHIQTKTGFVTKSVVLGYTQRGGSPSAGDRILATRLGTYAVELLAEGIGNKAVGIRDNKIIDIDIQQAIKLKKQFNQKLYDLAMILSR